MESEAVCPGFGREAHGYTRRQRRQVDGGLCPVCKRRRWASNLAEKRAAAGLCTRCGHREVEVGRRVCDECVKERMARGFKARAKRGG